MYSFLAQIWSSYIIEHPYESNPEKQNLLEDILKIEERLRKTFTLEQTALLFQYNDRVGEYHMLEEQDAFVNGVLFASAFFSDIIKSIGTN